MFRRIQDLNKRQSLFLFGARATGKTTLIHNLFKLDNILWVDLLTDRDEERFGRRPDTLTKVLSTRKFSRVVIDEIQKSPKLLDIVQLEMERNKKLQFILTGSSARKLKRGSANLLGGRAFNYHLYPLTYRELGEQFNLTHALQFGSLPKIFEFKSQADTAEYLRGYVANYLREEVLIEQLVRNLNPFRDFLEISAQTNGQIINFSKIARDVGVDDKTIRGYYQILEDTLVGYFLPPFHRSVRKRQREAPKFYLFDTGVKRAIEKTLRSELAPRTYAFGSAFEHFIINECVRLNDYYKLDFRFSYLRTKDNVEIDLIIERPGEKDLLIEIKSNDRITSDDARSLNAIMADWGKPAIAEIWSQDEIKKREGKTTCRHWREALDMYFKS